MERDDAPPLSTDPGALSLFFEDSVRETVDEQTLDIDDHTQAYLVNLLTQFTQRAALRTEEDRDLLDHPLALQVLRARTAETARRFHMLRQVGDVSLYMTGFFSERLERGLVDTTYYVDVGAGAYRHAARSISGPGDNPFRRLYEGLAARFVDLMHVLNAVSARCFRADTDVLRLYDRYLATGSERLAAQLAALGVTVGPRTGLAH
ncbi:MAG: hypothetical protein H6704_00950 [Myxococcales bacterium]|nr:hypothetical protein [Myxococcales bacterium]